MGKSKVSKLEFEHRIYVLGIASNEKIWKVCWGINQKMGLNMGMVPPDPMAANGLETYQDSDTDAFFEFQLVEVVGKNLKIPPMAQPFRFWLILKPKRDKEPETDAILSILKSIEVISTAQDLSAIKDIIKVLP